MVLHTVTPALSSRCHLCVLGHWDYKHKLSFRCSWLEEHRRIFDCCPNPWKPCWPITAQSFHQQSTWWWKDCDPRCQTWPDPNISANSSMVQDQLSGTRDFSGSYSCLPVYFKLLHRPLTCFQSSSRQNSILSMKSVENVTNCPKQIIGFHLSAGFCKLLEAVWIH